MIIHEEQLFGDITLQESITVTNDVNPNIVGVRDGVIGWASIQCEDGNAAYGFTRDDAERLLSVLTKIVSEGNRK